MYLTVDFNQKSRRNNSAVFKAWEKKEVDFSTFVLKEIKGRQQV